MENCFLVADKSRVWRVQNSDLAELLGSRRLYKSLSLVLAHRAEIKVPPSLLLLAPRRDLIQGFAEEFGFPLMIRVDYQSRPDVKPLGGIPLNSLEIVERVCKNLLHDACLPLLHPNLDRFKDLFSSGVLFSRGSDEVEVEVVGKGFDAGDLRLGNAVPQESFLVDLSVGAVRQHRIISDEAYSRQRDTRRRIVRKLRAYVHFANESGELLGDLGRFDHAEFGLSNEELAIPFPYQPMPHDVLHELLRVARKVKSGVIAGLPQSKVYVASMSFLPNEGWVLWDVYGEWYLR